MAMARAYAPQLTRWRAAVGGVERDLVQHEGTVLAVRRGDCRKEAGRDGGVERECVEIDGRVFELADEKSVAAHGGRARRCVEYSEGAGAAVLRLTVTEGMEVAEVVVPDGALRVMGSGGYVETGTGTREHVVDVQGEREAFVLLVSVSEELGRIVRIQRLN